MSAIFVTGPVQAGKTTLLERVIDSCAPTQKIYGFCTKKLPSRSKYSGAGNIYIYPAGGQLIADEAHCVGEVFTQQSIKKHSEVFESVGVDLLNGIPEGSIILMDELGFLENSAEKFCSRILELLNGDYLIIGAIKPRNLPFLNAVREHPKTKLYELTEQNRSELLPVVSEALKAALNKKP